MIIRDLYEKSKVRGALFVKFPFTEGITVSECSFGDVPAPNYKTISVLNPRYVEMGVEDLILKLQESPDLLEACIAEKEEMKSDYEAYKADKDAHTLDHAKRIKLSDLSTEELLNEIMRRK